MLYVPRNATYVYESEKLKFYYNVIWENVRSMEALCAYMNLNRAIDERRSPEQESKTVKNEGKECEGEHCNELDEVR